MGTFMHTITLLSASGDAQETVEALVDTGATFTSVAASVLDRLSVEDEGTVRLQLANGQIEEPHIGSVMAELNGTWRTIPCLFGESGDPSIIGAVALEIFLLSVNPVEQRLVPVVGYRL